MARTAQVGETFYGSDYFAWQAAIGRFGATVDRFKFQPFVSPDDRLIDFGCGAGDMIKALGVVDAVGVEINPDARRAAAAQGVRTVADLAALEDAWADVAISHHALEHVEHPLAELRRLATKLRSGGRLIVVVPCDRADYRFNENDQDQHLYSWSAGNLGNLVKAAGFRVKEAGEIVHKWPPGWRRAYRWLGPQGFHAASSIWGRLSRARRQVRVVAERAV